MAPVARYLLRLLLVVAISAAGGSLPAPAGHDFEEPVDFIPAEQVKRLLDIGEDIIFVDLRSASDFAKGHLPAARSIPIDTLGHRWKEIPTEGRVVLYCACPPGQQDEVFAFALMRQEKYRNVRVLEAGYADWVKRGYPIETVSP